MNRYPDRPDGASDGASFENLCLYLLRHMLHENPHPTIEKRDQIEIGDTFDGDDFKHLQKSFTRLHIEIAERTNCQSEWFRSGIWCNRRRIMCGKEDDIFLFSVESLR